MAWRSKRGTKLEGIALPSWKGNRGTRHERGYGHKWVKVRKLALARDGGFCQPCRRAGRDRLAREVDHITPVSKGGARYALHNLQSICIACHKEKTAREAEEARRARALEVHYEVGEDGWPIEDHAKGGGGSNP